MLEVDRRVAPADEARALGLQADARVILLRRLRLADGLPMAVERTLLRPRTAPRCSAPIWSRARCTRRSSALGHGPVGRARDDRAAAGRGRGRGAAGGARPATPLLVETRIVYDAGGRPIELTETRYSPTRYIFDIQLRRPAAREEPG